jgi:DNA-directed RNA polymerase specialized sigma subunit
MSLSKVIDDEDHFRLFTKSVETSISDYGDIPEDQLVDLQRQQVNELAALEEEFKKVLIDSGLGQVVYQKFLDHILRKRKNILNARVFFRERRDVFAKKISKAIANENINELQKYHINYTFISLANKEVKLPVELSKIINKIKAIRQQLVIMNIPLVINRARIFWSRTPKSHLAFMDLCQIGAEGLLSAIDKYAGEYNKVWVGVVIGRIVGFYIERYSSTLLHFHPTDRRKIYSANKFKSKHLHGDYEIEDLVAELSKSVSTDENDILGLMAASSVVSADTAVQNDKGETTAVQDSVYRYAAPNECRPDVKYETTESINLLKDKIAQLPLIDRKILILKGIDLSNRL